MPGELNLGTVYASMDLRLTRLEQGLAQAKSKFDAAGKTIEARSESMARNAGRSMENLGRTMSLAVAAPLVALGAAAIKTAVTFNRMERSLTSLTGSAAATKVELTKLREIAKAPGINFEQAVQGAVRLKAVGVNLDLVNRSLKEFANEVARGGGGAEELNRVTVQLAQMVGKGKVMAEDLQNIAESMPSVRQLMKEAFGTGDPEVLQKAKVTGQEFIALMTAAAEKHKQVVAGAEEQFDDAHQALREALNELGKSLMPMATRAADALGTALRGAAGWWKNLSIETQNWITGSAGAVIAIGGVTFALGKLLSMLVGVNAASVGILTRLGGPAGAATTAAGVAGMVAAGEAARGANPRFWAAGPGAVPPIALMPRNVLEAQLRNRPAAVLPNQQILAGRFQSSITAINAELGGSFLTPDRKAQLERDRAALISDAKKLGIVMPEGMPGLPEPEWLRKLKAGIQGRIGAAGNETARKKAEAAARKAAAARRQQESNQQRITDALGLGWYDPEQVLAQYLAWQKAGQAEQMGKGLADFAKSFVAAVANVVVGSMTGRAATMMGGAISGMGGAFGNALGTFRNVQGAAFLSSWRQTPQQALGGTFGGVMGAPGTAVSAAQQKVLGWMENAFGQGGGMWDSAKIKSSVKRGFDFVPDLAMNLADEFTDSFGRGLERAFGRNPFGRAIAHSLTNMMQGILDKVFMSGLETSGGEGGGGKGVNWGAMLGKLGLGAALGGLGSLFGGLFQEGGVVPGPAGRAKLAVVHGGEVVLNQRQQAAVAGGGITVNLGGVTIANRMDAAQVGREIAWQIQRRVRTLPGG